MRRIAIPAALACALTLAGGAGGQTAPDSERIELAVNGTDTTATSFARDREWIMRIEGVVTRTDKDGHVLSYDAVYCFTGCRPGGRTYNGLNAASAASNGFHQIAYFGTPLDPDPQARQQPRYRADHVYFFRVDDVKGPLALQAPPWGYVEDGDLLTGEYTITITETTAEVEDVRLLYSAKHAGLPRKPPPHLLRTTLEAKGSAIVQGLLIEDRPDDRAGAIKGTLVLHEITDGKVDPVTVMRIGPRVTYGSSMASTRKLDTVVTVRRSTAPGCHDGTDGRLYLSDERDAVILRICDRRYLFTDVDVRIREKPKDTSTR